MVTILIDQFLSNSLMYEHRCLENIHKLYKSDVKCDNRQQYKAILGVEMVSNPKIFIDNSLLSP